MVSTDLQEEIRLMRAGCGGVRGGGDDDDSGGEGGGGGDDDDDNGEG